MWATYKEWGELTDVIIVDLTSSKSESSDGFKFPLRTTRTPDLNERRSPMQPGVRLYFRCVLMMLPVIWFFCILVDFNRYYAGRDDTTRDVDTSPSNGLSVVV